MMENDAVELEAFREEDSSWRPCQISLNHSPDGVSLIVECEENESNLIILHKKEALKCIRVRSLHLQGDDCTNIKQGDHILASQDSQAKNLFFDGVVQKVFSVRHSKRIHCRCTFMVKWLHRDFKEAFVVPSSSIMKLSTKNMNVHSTVSKFLNMVKDIDSEMDLKESPQKQIDDVINSVQRSLKTSKEHLVCGVKVDTKGQVPQNQRLTRSKNKLPTEIKVRDPPPSPPFIKEDFLENRSPLNPLAARAALASLISKLPRNLECSNLNEEQKCFTYSSNIDKSQKEVNIEYVVHNSSMIDKFCSKMKNGSDIIGQKNTSIVKSLFCASVKKVDTKEMKLSCGSKRRLTRSRAHKEEIQANGSTNEISECDSSGHYEERNKKSSSNKRRITRSSGCLETVNNVTLEVTERLGENKVNENVKLNLYTAEKKEPVLAKEMNKKRKKENAGNVESGEVVKRKSTTSTKPALRSSPRFSLNKF